MLARTHTHTHTHTHIHTQTLSELYPLVPKRDLRNMSPSKLRAHSSNMVEDIKTPKISKSDVLGKKGLVQRLSMGFEQLEQNAKDTQIQLGAEGR